MSTGAAVTPPKTAATILIVEGVVLALLGLLSLALPVLGGLAAAIFVGWILVASGVMGIVTAFTTKPHVHFWWSLFSGAIAVIAGAVALIYPPAAIVGLTLVIAAWLAVDGVNSLMLASHVHKAHGSGAVWLVLTALVDWLLAIFLVGLSVSHAAVALGVIVGVDLFLGGLALIALGSSLRRRQV